MLSQSVNNDVGGFHYDQEPRGTSFISQVSKRDLWERRQMKRPMPRRGPQRRPAPNSRGAFAQGYKYREDDDVNSGGGGRGDGGFDEFKESVSSNLGAMTDLLKEMQRSQRDMVDRLDATGANDRAMNGNPPGGVESTSFGTSLDGKFNQNIGSKDGPDMVDPASMPREGSGQLGGDYYQSKIAQLETKINQINEAMHLTEDKLDTQMEYVDQRLGDIDVFEGMQFQPRPPLEMYLEERPPPPLKELPPPPPPPQESYEGSAYYVDDGTRYYQERNYNQPNVPPPGHGEIPSSQKKQQQSDQSANERSGAHHYQQGNRSFISAFSKADNERRREFDPFRDSQRGNQFSVREQLPRGAPPRRGGGFVAPPPEPMHPQYFEEPYFFEDGPLMDGPMMDEEYFYDDIDMYEF